MSAQRIDGSGPARKAGLASQAPVAEGKQGRPKSYGAGEEGFVLLAVIFMVALVALSLAIAAPKVAAAIRRDREVELVHRGEQYKRAIRLYYKKFGSYPSSIDQLEKTNNIRFLRKRYLDPLTGKDDWKPVLMGQAHLCPLGFFGQPLGMGAGIAGATPIAGGSNVSGFGNSAGIGGSSGMSGSGFGSGSSSMSGSSFGSTASSPGSGTGVDSLPAVGSGGTGCGVTGANASSSAGAGTGSDTSTDAGSGMASQGSSAGFGAGAASSMGTGSSSTSTSSTSGTLGGGTAPSTGFGASTSTTLGGAPLMGVMPPSTKATILLYKLKTHYNEWEFDYWPAEDQMANGGMMGGSGNINGTGNSVNGPGNTNGGVGGGFGGGSGSGFGASPGAGTSFQGPANNGGNSSGASSQNPMTP